MHFQRLGRRSNFTKLAFLTHFSHLRRVLCWYRHVTPRSRFGGVDPVRLSALARFSPLSFWTPAESLLDLFLNSTGIAWTSLPPPGSARVRLLFTGHPSKTRPEEHTDPAKTLLFVYRLFPYCTMFISCGYVMY